MLFVLLLPLFLVSGVGYLLARTRWLDPGWSTGLGELTARLLIPALLLNGAYKNGLPASVSWQVLCAFYIPLVGLFLLARYGYRRDADSAARSLAATYSNTAFVGIPVLVQAFGDDALQFAFPIIAFHGLIAFTLYYLTAPGSGSGARRVARSLGNAVRNPIVVSLMLGLALNLTGVQLPQAVTRLLGMVSTAALPCALLVLGASLAGLRVQAAGQAALVAAVKLMALPALVLVLGVWVFRLPMAAASVLVVLASCPVGVNAASVVQADGRGTALVSSAILLSSLACIVTMPLWLSILARL